MFTKKGCFQNTSCDHLKLSSLTVSVFIVRLCRPHNVMSSENTIRWLEPSRFLQHLNSVQGWALCRETVSSPNVMTFWSLASFSSTFHCKTTVFGSCFAKITTTVLVPTVSDAHISTGRCVHCVLLWYRAGHTLGRKSDHLLWSPQKNRLARADYQQELQVSVSSAWQKKTTVCRQFPY